MKSQSGEKASVQLPPVQIVSGRECLRPWEERVCLREHAGVPVRGCAQDQGLITSRSRREATIPGRLLSASLVR